MILSVVGSGGVRVHVVLSNVMNVPNGGLEALLIAKISESLGSTANSSARVGSVGSVWTLLTSVKVALSKETTRLGASVTKRQLAEVATPLGPAQSFAPAGGEHGVNPANPPGSCVIRRFDVVSTTSTAKLERSAR